MDKTELVNKLNEMRGSDHISEKYRLMLLNEYKEYCNKDKHTELIVFIEECAELIQCITKILRGRMKPNDISICEEIADVNILINQLLHLAGEGTKEKVKKQIEYKLQRTLKRIESGYYE